MIGRYASGCHGRKGEGGEWCCCMLHNRLALAFLTVEFEAWV